MIRHHQWPSLEQIVHRSHVHENILSELAPAARLVAHRRHHDADIRSGEMQQCHGDLDDVFAGCAAAVAFGGAVRGDFRKVKVTDSEHYRCGCFESCARLGGVIEVIAKGERDGVGVFETFNSTAVSVKEAEAYGLCDSCHVMELRKSCCQGTMKIKGMRDFERMRRC